jgi:hypothetical protein
MRVGRLPLASLPAKFRSAYTGHTHHGKAERIVAYASVVAWGRNETPTTLASPARFDRAVLTNARVALLTRNMNVGQSETTRLGYIEKRKLEYLPSEREGVGLLKAVDFVRERTKGKWRTIPGWRWIVCDEGFAAAFQEQVRATPRARMPR